MTMWNGHALFDGPLERLLRVLELLGLGDDLAVLLGEVLVLGGERLDDALQPDDLFSRGHRIVASERAPRAGDRRPSTSLGRRRQLLQSVNLALGAAEVLAQLGDEVGVMSGLALRLLEDGLGRGELLVHALEVVCECRRRVAARLVPQALKFGSLSFERRLRLEQSGLEFLDAGG